MVGELIRQVCAWCSATIREGSDPTSHGICLDCQLRLLSADVIDPPSYEDLWVDLGGEG